MSSSPSSLSKGTGRATEEQGSTEPDASSSSSSQAATEPSTSTTTTASAPAPASASATVTTSTSSTPASSTKAKAGAGAPVVAHTKGDWSAVWNPDRKQYYFWQRSTGKTTWENPFAAAGDGKDKKEEGGSDGAVKAGIAAGTKPTTATSGSPEPSAAAAAAPSTSAPSARATGSASPAITTTATIQPPLPSTSASSAAAMIPQRRPVDYGGIDPDLAYLDPSLAARASGGDARFAARFNAKTGRFEGDPSRAPDRVGDFERSKRQNNFFFDYDNWAKTEALKQEQAAAQKRSAEEAELGYGEHQQGQHKRPSKKEMEAIKARNKEKKERKQKGWLMSG